MATSTTAAASRGLPFDRARFFFVHLSCDPAPSCEGPGLLLMSAPFFIVGPTAVGKTGIAVAVAERCGAEIINADAFQVYAGLRLLTAKPSQDELRRVPHHLVGAVALSETYNVARYAEAAHVCLNEITRRQRPAIIVGGSGMYVKALTHGLSPLPPAQPVLRAVLETLDLATLQKRLRALDPATSDVVDGKNKRRLVRAIEVCEVTGRRFSEFRDRWVSAAESVASSGVFLVRPKCELDERIKRRVKAMFACGVIEEVQAIDPQHVSETASRMIGWREMRAYLTGEFTLATCLEKIEAATRRYAKRQITWFRGERIFEEFVLSDGSGIAVTVDHICERLGQHGADGSFNARRE